MISVFPRGVGVGTRFLNRLSEHARCISASISSRYQNQFGVVGNWLVVAALHSVWRLPAVLLPECIGTGINRIGASRTFDPLLGVLSLIRRGGVPGQYDRELCEESSWYPDKQLQEHSPDLRILFLISDHQIGRFFVFC